MTPAGNYIIVHMYDAHMSQANDSGRSECLNLRGSRRHKSAEEVCVCVGGGCCRFLKFPFLLSRINVFWRICHFKSLHALVYIQ